MRLTELLSAIDIKEYSSTCFDDCEVTGICHDSRKAACGVVFLCKSGAVSDGHVYAPSAYSNGARVFIAERPLSLPNDALVCIVENTAQALSALSQKFYNYPAKELDIIGITGTKGKTTLALSIYSIGSEYGLKMGYIGTNGVLYGNVHEDTANTTPDPLELQRILREMSDAGVKYIALEVSSQALWQKRVDGLSFHTCVFTNLYPDHIGGVEHPTFEHYRDCKKSLFDDYATKNVVINLDSPQSQYMTSGVETSKIISVSASGDTRADLYAKDIQKTFEHKALGIKFSCFGKDFSEKDILLCSPGIYSAENALEAIAVCRLLGIDIDFIADALKSLVTSGRCETVTLPTKPHTLFVIDYAHNGASLSSVLSALREYQPRRIICLFGSVGGRTFGRRAELAEAAKSNSDVIIVTSDNPAGEAPMNIIDEICSHLTDFGGPVYKFEDRAEAIRFAAEISEAGDFVLLAGKGHENYQLIRGRKVPFCERQILLDTEKKKKNQLFKL